MAIMKVDVLYFACTMMAAMIMRLSSSSSSSSSSKLFVFGDSWEPTWSRMAAKEAEEVAAIECSGHGRAYLDGLILHGHKPACECNSCYYGPNCSLFNSSCSANALSGDPYFLEPYWMGRASKSGLVVAGWHRMGYTFSDGTYISEMLLNHIQKLHKIVGNAVTDGKYIIFGAGSTQLFNAAVYALSFNSSSSSPAKVVTTAPNYSTYRAQTQLFNSQDYRFEGDTSLWKNKSSDNKNSTFIEFVTSPTNPEGKLSEAVLEGPNVKAIYDHAYFWPHYSPIPSPSDQDLMVFSISKLTGHAGTRFGWALIKDEGVYERMLRYLTFNTIGVSRDAQLRALKLLDVIVEEDDGREIFNYAYSNMRNKWRELTKILSNSNRFSLQKLTPQYCSFYHRLRDPTPAYAWLKCEREEDEDCSGVLQRAANISGYPGSAFNAEDRYVRLSLIRTQDDFNMLIHHLTNLVAQE